jgi:biotin carboxyl carrier protein
LGLQCQTIEGVRSALLLLADVDKTFVPAAIWPGKQTDVTYLGAIAQRCLNARAGQVEPAGEAGDRVLIAYPIELVDQLEGAIILDMGARPPDQVQSVLRALHWGSARLEVLLQQRTLDLHQKNFDRVTMAVDLVAGLGEYAHLDEAAMHLANDLASRLGCERVAVGIEFKDRVRLQALSSQAWFERKSEFVVAIENAMEEALDQGGTISYPALPGAPSRISVAHRNLGHQGTVVTVLLSVQGQGIGAITCYRAEPPDADFVANLEAIAAVVAPSLSAQRELHRWFAGRLANQVKHVWQGLFDPRRPSFRVAAVLVVLVVAFISLVQGKYRVSGRAAVEGEVQRAIVAPYDGFIAKSSLRAGQQVKAGEVLARLDDRDLLLERQRWLAEQEQADRKYSDALAKHESANAHILAAQLAEAAAQLDLADDKLARSTLVAPFDGVIVSGDLSQMLGTPVEKGKVLFEVAPMDAYRVVLKVPENGIRDVRIGQTGQIVLAGMSDQTLPFRVKNVGVAAAEDGENLFRIEAQLESALSGIRPGMEGVGKVQVGERRLIWIWTHPFFDWLGLKLWHWLP